MSQVALTLSQDELKYLDTLVGELKTKDGIPFVQFLSNLLVRQQQEAQQAAQKPVEVEKPQAVEQPEAKPVVNEEAGN